MWLNSSWCFHLQHLQCITHMTIYLLPFFNWKTAIPSQTEQHRWKFIGLWSLNSNWFSVPRSAPARLFLSDNFDCMALSSIAFLVLSPLFGGNHHDIYHAAWHPMIDLTHEYAHCQTRLDVYSLPDVVQLPTITDLSVPELFKLLGQNFLICSWNILAKLPLLAKKIFWSRLKITANSQASQYIETTSLLVTICIPWIQYLLPYSGYPIYINSRWDVPMPFSIIIIIPPVSASLGPVRGLKHGINHPLCLSNIRSTKLFAPFSERTG